MFYDYYLQFENQAAAEAALFDSYGRPLDQSINIDIIGVWYDIDNANPEAPIVTARAGYYVNVRSATEWTVPASAIANTPITPWRVWA